MVAKRHKTLKNLHFSFYSWIKHLKICIFRIIAWIKHLKICIFLCIIAWIKL